MALEENMDVCPQCLSYRAEGLAHDCKLSQLSKESQRDVYNFLELKDDLKMRVAIHHRRQAGGKHGLS